MDKATIRRLEAVPLADLSRAQKALRALLRLYEKKSDNAPCPLCKYVTGCEMCPWRIFTGMDCVVYGANWVADHGLTPDDPHGLCITWLRDRRPAGWLYHRRRQVKMWMRHIEKEIDARCVS